MKRMFFILIAVLVLLLASSQVSASEVFNRFLQKGDSGSDVLILQKFLNMSPDTKVAQSGPGSYGQETSFFGEATKQALIKYQKKKNLGSQFGFFTIYSGSVDEKTKEALNSDLEGLASSTSNGPTSCGQPLKALETGSILNKFFGSISSRLAIQEKGEELNRAILNGGSEAKWAALNGIMQANFPANTLPFISSIEVVDKNSGKVNKVDLSKTKESSSIKVTSMLPTSLVNIPEPTSMVVKAGDTVRIKGCNFGESNVIHAGYKSQTVKSSSNGTVLEFKPELPLQDTIDDALDNLNSNERKTVIENINKRMKLPESTTSFTGGQNIPGIPVFFFIETGTGYNKMTSNAYMMFAKII